MLTAKVSLGFTGLFESELLIELMLRFWNHPLADDREFRNDLLEAGAEVLRAAIAGQAFVEGLPPEHMNLVAAVWYAEWVALTDARDIATEELSQRERWLEAVRHAVPSCFCNPSDLA